MQLCNRCGSYAINPSCHGRDQSDLNLCDVCYWRKRAESGQNLTDAQLDAKADWLERLNKLHRLLAAEP